MKLNLISPMLAFFTLFLPTYANPTGINPLSRIAAIGCTNHVNKTEAQHAILWLASYCARYGPIDQNTKLSWTVGKTRAYACNYAWSTKNPCTYGEHEKAWAAIKQKCGEDVGGWWFEKQWEKTYGVDLASAGWCSQID
ncbi:hypothetical protein B0H63DRAFT_193116 [Podospora didyma]|uniref:Secreted protein n=1 Tax=Podospora didyma TaxID=330526 RepID=A0AAE0TV87_9PEZI|nr:hypothetical protein B0H63DRAFT_193116 [Podospora didyma]